MDLKLLDGPKGVTRVSSVFKILGSDKWGFLHDGPVLHSGVVGKAENGPNDNVLVEHILVTSGRVSDATDFSTALQSIATSGIQLVILVLGDPKMVVSEQSTLGLNAVGVGKQKLRGRDADLVSNRFSADRVPLCQVLDLKGTVIEGSDIDTARRRDGRLAHFVVVSVGVCPLVSAHWQTLFLNHCVGLAVNGGIHADAEDVLMVLGQGAGADHVAPGCRLAFVDVDDGHDTGGSGLNLDTGRLVELVGKDVFIVGQSDDELNNELAASSHDGPAGSPVGVLPVDAVILLVQADDLLGHLSGTI